MKHFSKTDHMLGHKTSPSKFKRTEITSNIFLEPQWYETSGQLHEENQKISKYVEIKQNATDNQRVKEDIQREIKKQKPLR